MYGASRREARAGAGEHRGPRKFCQRGRHTKTRFISDGRGRGRQTASLQRRRVEVVVLSSEGSPYERGRNRRARADREKSVQLDPREEPCSEGCKGRCVASKMNQSAATIRPRSHREAARGETEVRCPLQPGQSSEAAVGLWLAHPQAPSLIGPSLLHRLESPFSGLSLTLAPSS